MCLHCPQVTDELQITATDTKSEVTEMAKTGRHNSRTTCKTCNTPDSFNFSQGNCRKCQFALKEGRTPARMPEIAPASKIAQPPAEENLGTAGIAAAEAKPWPQAFGEKEAEEMPNSQGPVRSAPRNPPMTYVLAFLDGKKRELEELNSHADYQSHQLEITRAKLRVVQSTVQSLQLAIELDMAEVSL